MSMAFSSLYKWAMAKVPEVLQFSMAVLQEVSFSLFLLLNTKSSKFAMFRLKNEKTLRIFSSILKSYKREKHLQPFRLFINFIKMCKKVLEIVTMICYNVSAFIKR